MEPTPQNKSEFSQYEKHFNALKGLRPELVINLAALHGTLPEGLNAIIHMMPFGDRVTLSAYGYFPDSQTTVMSPQLTELIEVAFEVTLGPSSHKTLLKPYRPKTTALETREAR